MSYKRCIHQLYQVNKFGGMKLGLENMRSLMSLLNLNGDSFRSIHIAGTNGKGSVTTKIASALQAQGYSTGLYTSPHISCFRERIRINQEMIAEKEVEGYLTEIFDLCQKHSIPATFFEITTAMAFMHFSAKQVDFAVIETGLGGRIDATNILHPELCVITSISLDHTEILGTTIEEIAREKGGIIKDYVPVVIGPHVPEMIMAEIAAKHHSPLIKVNRHDRLFDEENSLIAKTALDYLSSKFPLTPQNIQSGIQARPPCRMQEIPHAGLRFPIILDVGHNPHGLHQLFKALRKKYPTASVTTLFGLSKTKDIEACLEIIVHESESFFPIEATNGRGVTVSSLVQELHSKDVTQHAIHRADSIHTSVMQAIDYARLHNTLLLICGSFFIMSAVRQALQIEEACDDLDMNEK